jgi:hypothetical protein
VLQHLPASYRHAVATCRAPIVEDRLLKTPSYLSQLRMSYCLPPQYLGRLWGHVLAAVSQAALGDFRHPELFVAANGTKLQFKYPGATSDLLAVMQTFDFKILGVLNFSHVLDDRLYLDVGKETCPMDAPPERGLAAIRLVTLWSIFGVAVVSTITSVNSTTGKFRSRAKHSTTSQCFAMLVVGLL